MIETVYYSLRPRQYGSTMCPDNLIKPSTPAFLPLVLYAFYSLGLTIPCTQAAIQCFVCEAAHVNAECNGTENMQLCPITYDTCMTMLRFASGKLLINKLCSKRDSCWTQRRVLGAYGMCDNETDEWACISCCDVDLCNTSPAGSPLRRLPVSALTTALLVFLSQLQ